MLVEGSLCWLRGRCAEGFVSAASEIIFIVLRRKRIERY